MPLTVWQQTATGRRMVHGAGVAPVPDPDDLAGVTPIGLGAAIPGTAHYPVPADGSARWVSPSGTDTPTAGSQAAPWRTLEYALSRIQAGQTIILAAGVYHEGRAFTSAASNETRGYIALQVTQSDVTIQSAPGAEVWLDGSTVLPSTGFTADAAAWSTPYTPLRRDLYSWASVYPPSVDNFTDHEQGWPSLDSQQAYWGYVDYELYPTAGWPERLWIDGVEQTQIGTLGDLAPGRFYASPYTNRLYLAVNPAGHEVRITRWQTLLNSLAAGFTLRGIGIRRYAATLPQFGVVKLHRPDAALENVLFEGISGKALSVLGDPNTTNGSNRTRIERCTFQGISQLGLHIDQCDDIAVSDCRFTDCNTGRFNAAPEAGGWKATRVRNLTVTRCLHQDIWRAKGGWLDVDVNKVTLASNHFVRCGQRGIVYELCRDVLDIDSVHIGHGAEAIVFQDSENGQVWNASIYDVGRARGQRNGDVTLGCTGIAIFTTARAGATPAGASRFTYHDSASRLTTWPTPMASRYMPADYVIRNIFFGASNYETFWRDQVIGGDATDGGPTILREYTLDGLDIDHNVFNGHPSKQVMARTYPWVLRKSTAGQNHIYQTLTALRTGTATNPDGAFDSASIADTTTDWWDASRDTITDTHRTTADGVAQPLPATIAAHINRTTGDRRMGAFDRSIR